MRSRCGAPWPTVRFGGRERPEGEKLTVGGVEEWVVMPCRFEVMRLRCGRAVPCQTVSVTKRRRCLWLRRPPPPRQLRCFLPLLPSPLPPLSWFRCAAYGHQMAASDGRSLGLRGWGSYSQSFGHVMDKRLEMARCARRAVTASRLGLWSCDAVVGAMENPFA